MWNGLPRVGPSKRPQYYSLAIRGKQIPEQIAKSFVYHSMKLLILGIIAIWMLSAASGFRHRAYWDCGWRNEAHQHWRERNREIRDDLRAQREAAREEARRIREEIRHDMDDFRHDWR
jgi:hypothetical protein